MRITKIQMFKKKKIKKTVKYFRQDKDNILHLKYSYNSYFQLHMQYQWF